MEQDKKRVSILIPAYNEQDSVVELYRQIIVSINAMINRELVSEYEIWFIDDGSTDKTFEQIKSIVEYDSNVHAAKLRRNFGKSQALQVGFNQVKGDLIFTIDADLQDDPAEFSNFVDCMLKGGYDLVVGWKENRKDSLEKVAASRLFNFVTSRVSGVKLHDFDNGFKLYKRSVINALSIYGEFHRYIPVMAHRYGFSIGEVRVNHRKRKHGESKYGVERYLKGAFDSLTTTFLLKYADRPMYFFGRIGLCFTTVGVVMAVILCINKFLGEAIGTRPLLTLATLLIIMGWQSVATGFICNLIVDKTLKRSEANTCIEEIYESV